MTSDRSNRGSVDGRNAAGLAPVDAGGQLVATSADRLTPLLRLVAGGLLVVVLASALAFTLYVKSIQAPRTFGERSIEVYRAAVAEHPEVVDNHIKLAYAYALAGRYDEALAAVNVAERMTDDPRADVQLALGDVLRSAGRYGEAIEAYDISARVAEENAAQAKAESEKRGIAYDVPNTALAGALAGRAVAEWESGDRAGAFNDIEAALAITPTDAALLVTLGDYRAGSGDTSAAVAAYNEALRYVPDSPQARVALRKLAGE